MSTTLRRRTAAVSVAVAAGLVAAACGGSDTAESGPSSSAPRAGAIAEPIAVTYDGGIAILDGTTMSTAKTVAIDGFTRLNPAGDDRHILVTTPAGWQVLDAGTGELTDQTFTATDAGHVVTHGGTTVLFDDGTGKVTMFDPEDLGGDALPEVTEYTTPAAHHGVAVLSGDDLVVTEGTEDARTGIVVLDKDREPVTRNADCPGVHGEATAQDEVIAVGCENGMLLYSDGAIRTVTSPDPYGRIGNQAGSDSSPYLLGDYKKDEDAELERPTQVSIVDTRSASMRLVDLGTSYTFRSLGRGPSGEALVLGTDGKLHSIDPQTGQITRSEQVVDAWEEPIEWQDPRPALRVRGNTAYITDPATRSLRTVDLSSFTVGPQVSLPGVPNEIAAA
ncbi:zinc metallochaperone AztD [Williamsia sp. SKLECPSW1]